MEEHGHSHGHGHAHSHSDKADAQSALAALIGGGPDILGNYFWFLLFVNLLNSSKKDDIAAEITGAIAATFALAAMFLSFRLNVSTQKPTKIRLTDDNSQQPPRHKLSKKQKALLALGSITRAVGIAGKTEALITGVDGVFTNSLSFSRKLIVRCGTLAIGTLGAVSRTRIWKRVLETQSGIEPKADEKSRSTKKSTADFWTFMATFIEWLEDSLSCYYYTKAWIDLTQNPDDPPSQPAVIVGAFFTAISLLSLYPHLKQHTHYQAKRRIDMDKATPDASSASAVSIPTSEPKLLAHAEHQSDECKHEHGHAHTHGHGYGHTKFWQRFTLLADGFTHACSTAGDYAALLQAVSGNPATFWKRTAILAAAGALGAATAPAEMRNCEHAIVASNVRKLENETTSSPVIEVIEIAATPETVTTEEAPNSLAAS